MNKIKNIREKSTSYLSFKIGEELFAAHVAHVNNIIEVPRITKIPNSPDYLLGVINLRGAVLPIIDTCVKFNLLPIKLTKLSCVLVLEINIEGNIVPVGALVDNVHEVLEINNNEILPPPQVHGLQAANIFIEGMVKTDEQFIMLLNIDKLFDKDSLQIIKNQTRNVETTV